MKFLCVPCDSPMKLQTVGPPERGSLSVVYSCPECGYEMAMLTIHTRHRSSSHSACGSVPTTRRSSVECVASPAAGARSPR